MGMSSDRAELAASKPIPVKLRQSVIENLPFIIVTSAFIIAAIVIFPAMGLYLARPMSYLFNLVLYGSAVTLLIAVPFLYQLFKVRPESPFEFARQLASRWRLVDRIKLGAPAIILLLIFMPTFSAFKSAIPAFQPFIYDPLFAEWDSWLHGGDAWRLIQPLVGYPFVSFLINWLYHSWILLLYAGVTLVAGWVEQPKVRMQFLVSYALCWILLGTVAAILLSSVGPVFYDDFYGNDQFEPLMAYLAHANEIYPLPALEVQDTLLIWAENGSNGLGRGITAMPSMHLAIACLFAILGWKISTLWGVVSTVFLAIIMIGSVHLGYHYAIDGYVSILAVLLLWWCVGKLFRRFDLS